MSKGLVGSFVGLYSAILTDYGVYRPTATKDVERDKTRIMSLASNLGLSLFTIVLPSLATVFEQALDSGRLLRSGLPLTRPYSSRTVIPRLFRGIWLRIFDDSGCLKQDIDPTDILFLRTLFSVGKKYRLDCSESKTLIAVKDFFDVDQALPPPSLYWDGDGADVRSGILGSFEDRSLSDDAQPSLFPDRGQEELELLRLVQLTADRVSWVLGDYVASDYRFKHGPGATSEYRRSGSYKYKFPNWSSRLQRVYPADVFGIPNASVLGDGWSDGVVFPKLETHSRLIAVPKTQKGPRLIAAEPTCHQWCQQNVRDFLDTRIQATWLGRSIDFRRQDLSGDLARSASRTGSHATLDLKEASDRLSTWFVQRLFRKNLPLLEALIVTRTRYISNTIDKKSPSLTKLRKFASMGSALTFPVQSIAFLTVCLAAGLSVNGLASTDKNTSRLARQVRVYGDDLIVPVSWVPRVRQLLELLYLKLNDRKSFWNGKFREACGTDAYDGTNVSPAYVREMYTQSKPSSLASTVDTCNNLYHKGMWHASQFLWSLVPKVVQKHVPFVRVGSGTFGLETASGYSYNGGNRWNLSLQRWESRVYTLLSVSDVSLRYEGAENLLQFFTEARRPSTTPHLDEPSRVTGLFSAAEQKLALRWVAVE